MNATEKWERNRRNAQSALEDLRWADARIFTVRDAMRMNDENRPNLKAIQKMIAAEIQFLAESYFLDDDLSPGIVRFEDLDDKSLD